MLIFIFSFGGRFHHVRRFARTPLPDYVRTGPGGPVFVLIYKTLHLLCHLILGFGIGLAPAGAWVAVSGQLDWRILLLSFALMTYIAGFDILYSCQDIEFDRDQHLFSLPACWGAQRALFFSTGLHALTLVFLLLVYFAFDLASIYLLFLLLIGVLIFVEHRLVRPDCLDKVNVAFFHVNSAVSILLFLGVLAGTVVHMKSAYQNLGEFISELKKAGELLRVRRPRFLRSGNHAALPTWCPKPPREAKLCFSKMSGTRAFPF